jgi:hypothetical protein
MQPRMACENTRAAMHRVREDSNKKSINIHLDHGVSNEHQQRIINGLCVYI